MPGTTLRCESLLPTARLRMTRETHRGGAGRLQSVRTDLVVTRAASREDERKRDEPENKPQQTPEDRDDLDRRYCDDLGLGGCRRCHRADQQQLNQAKETIPIT